MLQVNMGTSGLCNGSPKSIRLKTLLKILRESPVGGFLLTSKKKTDGTPLAVVEIVYTTERQSQRLGGVIPDNDGGSADSGAEIGRVWCGKVIGMVTCPLELVSRNYGQRERTCLVPGYWSALINQLSACGLLNLYRSGWDLTGWVVVLRGY